MRISNPERVLAAVGEFPWAIYPPKGEEIVRFLNSRAEGGEVAEEELQAITRGSRTKIAATSGGVAIIPLMGVIAPRMDAMTRFSGGTGCDSFGARFDEAMDNDDVGTVVIHIDSPGGSVQGVPELAAKMFARRGEKRVLAVADGLMASAAYWIGANADEIVITPSGLIGSIGVFAIHTEVSRAEDAAGITRSVLFAGRFKAEGNMHEPLSDDAREHMQERIDQFYGMFVQAVARARGVSEEAVRTGFAEGSVVTSLRAVEDGLADRVATFEDVISELGVAPASLREARATEEAEQQGEPEELAPVALELVPAATVLEPAAVTATGGQGLNVLTLTPHDLRYIGSGSRETLILEAGEDEGQAPKVPPVEPEEDTTPHEGEPEEEIEEESGDPDGDESSAQVQSPTPTPPRGEEETVEAATVAAPGTEGAEAGSLELRVLEDRAAERERLTGIMDLCETLEIPHRAGEFVNNGMTVDQARRFLKLEATEGAAALTTSPIELSPREAKRYSITRAILGNADAQMQDTEWSGFEREVSDEIAKNLPSNYASKGGIFVPTRAARGLDSMSPPLSNYRLGQLRTMVLSEGGLDPMARGRMLQQIGEMQAVLDATNAGAGPELVFTEAGDFIDLLRARMKVIALGAQQLTGLVGPVAFPKQTAASTWTWVAEDPGADVADSDMTLTQVALNPNAGQSSTAYTRQLLAQNSVDVDMLVKNDLAQVAALGIDLAAIAGTGAGNQPTGILNTAGIGDVDIGANGGLPLFGHMVDLETDVAAANADIGTQAYLTTPGIRGRLKQTAEFGANTDRPVWRDGEVNGYRAEVSTQVPSNLTDGTGTNLHAIIFGVWATLMIGYWGAYELVVDPFALKKRAVIEVTSFQMVGLALRYPEAFSAVQDASLT